MAPKMILMMIMTIQMMAMKGSRRKISVGGSMQSIGS